jgi:enamine deaminase RidA (YjgF/YER057c/UK114 family)
MNEEVVEKLASERLVELGIELPAVAVPVAAYVPAVASSGQVFTSGQLPIVAGELLATGKVGAEVSAERAAELARVAMLNAVAAAASVVGGVDGIRRVLKVTVFVASAPGFTGQPQVADGGSELLLELFGARGRHARSAVGVAELPLNTPVELELVVEANAASF